MLWALQCRYMASSCMSLTHACKPDLLPDIFDLPIIRHCQPLVCQECCEWCFRMIGEGGRWRGAIAAQRNTAFYHSVQHSSDQRSVLLVSTAFYWSAQRSIGQHSVLLHTNVPFQYCRVFAPQPCLWGCKKPCAPPEIAQWSHVITCVTPGGKHFIFRTGCSHIWKVANSQCQLALGRFNAGQNKCALQSKGRLTDSCAARVVGWTAVDPEGDALSCSIVHNTRVGSAVVVCTVASMCSVKRSSCQHDAYRENGKQVAIKKGHGASIVKWSTLYGRRQGLQSNFAHSVIA